MSANAFDRLTDALEKRGSHVKRTGDRQAVAQCPAHDDNSPSLSLRRGDECALLHCFAGCQPADVVAALGLRLADLYDNPREKRYEYRDLDGNLTRAVVRTLKENGDLKRFSQTVTPGSANILYRLPDVVAEVKAGGTVYLVEGEKDADNARVLDVVATTAPMGSSNFNKVDVSPLEGAHVVAVVDRDEAGQKWAVQVRDRLTPVAASLRFVEAAEGKDLSDHLAAGMGVGDLVDLPALSGVLEPVDELHEHAEGYARLVAEEVLRQRARADAKAILDKERAGAEDLPDVVSLTEFLAEPDEPTAYLINEVWPKGGRVLLAAPKKAGKSTMVANILRSLVDGEPFLGRFLPEPVGRVILVDDELDANMLRRWLREQGIRNTDAVELVALRGKVRTFDLLTPATLERWAGRLGAGDVLIFDCLRPVLDALKLSEDKEAGRFLTAFDELLDTAGIRNGMVIHHHGHGAERARGDSRLGDWPDAIWNIVTDKKEDGQTAGQVSRYFTAEGRDVDQPQQRLGYDAATRRLSIVGGSRADAVTEGALLAILEHLEHEGEQSGNQIELALKGEHSQTAIREALRKGREDLAILTKPGKRNATLHYLPSSSVRGSSSAVRDEVSSEFVSSSYRDEQLTHNNSTDLVATNSEEETEPEPTSTPRGWEAWEVSGYDD